MKKISLKSLREERDIRDAVENKRKNTVAKTTKEHSLLAHQKRGKKGERSMLDLDLETLIRKEKQKEFIRSQRERETAEAHFYGSVYKDDSAEGEEPDEYEYDF